MRFGGACAVWGVKVVGGELPTCPEHTVGEVIDELQPFDGPADKHDAAVVLPQGEDAKSCCGLAIKSDRTCKR